MTNRNVPHVNLSWIFAENYGTLVVFCLGLIEFVSASGFLFFRDFGIRLNYIKMLLVLLVFDILFVHLPIAESARNWGNEMTHCTFGLAIAGGLLMVGGFRRND